MSKFTEVTPGELELLKEMQAVHKEELALQERKLKAGGVCYKAISTHPGLLAVLGFKLNSMRMARQELERQYNLTEGPPPTDV